MDKDIRFTEKKVDDSWKEQAERDKGVPTRGKGAAQPEASPKKQASIKTSKPFLNFATSLAMQALMHLGEMPNPETGKTEVNPEAAREIIDLLVALKEKSADHLSPEEKHFFESALPQIQLKFSQTV